MKLVTTALGVGAAALLAATLGAAPAAAATDGAGGSARAADAGRHGSATPRDIVVGDCASDNSVTIYVETTIGGSIYCYSGTGIVQQEYPDVTRFDAGPTANGEITFANDNGPCKSDGFGPLLATFRGGASFPFDPEHKVRICSVTLTG